MSPLFITSVVGLALMTVGLAQVAPSVAEAIAAKKVEIHIGREEALMQQIIRYRALENAFPANVGDLVSKGYWRAGDNDNGMGGVYSFAIDEAKGLISITTNIPDATRRARYIDNYRNVFKPVDSGGGNVATTFVMPSTGALATPFPPTGAVPVANTAPSAVTNTYWYDTSGSTVKLKVSDGATWMDLVGQGGGAAPTVDNILSSINNLPGTANVGDIRYVYDAQGNVLDSYTYYNGGWVLFGGAGHGADATPDLFAFDPASVPGINPSSVVTSSMITMSGLGVRALISATVTNGSNVQCQIDGASWGACSGYAINGTTVSMRFTASAEYSTTASAQLSVGGVKAVFSATTKEQPPAAPAGYAQKGFPDPIVGDNHPGPCAAGFIPVPAMTIPADVGQSYNVPAFCVMQYVASPSNTTAAAQAIFGDTHTPTFRVIATYQPAERAEGFTLSNNTGYKPKSDAVGKPWTYISYYEAAAACNSMGMSPGGKQIRLMRESEWMAIAHNAVMVNENWSGGKVDVGDLYRGVGALLSDIEPYKTSGAQPASIGDHAGTDQQRTKFLTNGQTVWDIGGHMYQYTYHDFPEAWTYGRFGNLVRHQQAAPYNSSTRGMGVIYDTLAGGGFTLPYSGWSTKFPMRGSDWKNDFLKGAFHIAAVQTPSFSGSESGGFRCSHE
jgi:hypothetical protein